MNVLADRWSDFKTHWWAKKGRRLEMRAQPSNTPDIWKINFRLKFLGIYHFEIITENMRTCVYFYMERILWVKKLKWYEVKKKKKDENQLSLAHFFFTNFKGNLVILLLKKNPKNSTILFALGPLHWDWCLLFQPTCIHIM